MLNNDNSYLFCYKISDDILLVVDQNKLAIEGHQVSKAGSVIYPTVASKILCLVRQGITHVQQVCCQQDEIADHILTAQDWCGQVRKVIDLWHNGEGILTSPKDFGKINSKLQRTNLR